MSNPSFCSTILQECCAERISDTLLCTITTPPFTCQCMNMASFPLPPNPSINGWTGILSGPCGATMKLNVNCASNIWALDIQFLDGTPNCFTSSGNGVFFSCKPLFVTAILPIYSACCGGNGGIETVSIQLTDFP